MRLLILNEDPFFLDKAKRYFFKRGFQIHLGDNGMDGLVQIINYQPEAIITHVNLEAINGIDLYRLVKTKGSFSGKFYFIRNESVDDEFNFNNELLKIYSEKTAFSKILANL